MALSSRIEYDRILKAAASEKSYEGLKILSEETRRTILADNVVVLMPNPQCTFFNGTVNGENICISAKSTVLSVVFHTGENVSAKFGDQNFDPRIQQVLKMKVKSFQAGLLKDHEGNKLGLLLIIRKRPEMVFEKELNNLLHIFSLYISREKLSESYSQSKEKVEQIIETCAELLNTVTLHSFMQKLEQRLPKIFSCERGNILLFDYEKNNLFRRVSENKYENFPIFHGLSGNCVNTKRTNICNDITIERMFYKDMDDPHGDNTKSIISVPLFSKFLENIPEAVVQLINKADGSFFNENDESMLVKFTKMITDCMIVLQFSSLSASLVDAMKKLDGSLEKMSDDMNHRVYDFGFVKSSIVIMKAFFLKFS